MLQAPHGSRGSSSHQVRGLKGEDARNREEDKKNQPQLYKSTQLSFPGWSNLNFQKKVQAILAFVPMKTIMGQNNNFKLFFLIVKCGDSYRQSPIFFILY